MALTAGYVTSIIKHAVAGPLSSPLSELQLANEAGEYMVGLHKWSYLKEAEALIGTVASQEYIELPLDFGQPLSLEVTDGFTDAVVMTDPGTFNRVRTGSFGNGAFSYWLTLEYAVPATGDEPKVPTPRLAIWPTPTSTDADWATLRYRAAWTPLTASDDVVQIPRYCETLYLSICRAMAQGYEEDEGVELEDRLLKIAAGTVALAAKRADAAHQWNYGKLKGGAGMVGTRWTSWEGPMAGPSTP